MLDRDVTFEGWTAADWSRLVSLFQPVRRDAPEAESLGGVIAIHGGGKLRKLLHTRAGRLDPSGEPWPSALADLAARHRASWALSAQAGGLDEISERFGARARRTDDLTVQALSLATIVRELYADGVIDSWPQRLEGMPVPTPPMIDGLLEMVCPRGRALLVGVFEHGELWTSLAILRGAGGVERIVGPDAPRVSMGLLSGDWRRDYRHLARATEAEVGPLALGCFAEVGTIRALEVDGSPGAWARAVAVRDVILSPLPPALAIPLGVDAARATLAAVRSAVVRADVFGVVPPLVQRLRTAAGLDGARRTVARFDALDALRRVLSR